MTVKSVQTKSAIYKNLTGGLNVREAVTAIGDTEGISISNLIFYTGGELVRRGGWKKLFNNSPTTNALTGIYQAGFISTSGTYTYYLVITDGIKMWATANPLAKTVAWTDITNGKTLDNSRPYVFSMMAGYMLAYNGVASPFYWQGDLATGLQSFSSSTYAIQIGDIALTAVSSGTGGQGITFQYLSGGTAGHETVSVSTKAITVTIADGISTATQIVTALTASSAASALVTASTLNGTAPQSVSDATTAIPLVPTGAPPIGRIGIVWQNTFFFGGGQQGTTQYPSRLFFSNLGDPTTYPASNFIDVESPYSDEPITGFAILYGNLIIFKRFSIYILQGAPPDNLVLTKLNASIGCTNPESVVSVDNLFYFISDRGLYEGNLFNVKQSSYKVEPRYLVAIPQMTDAQPIYAVNYKPRGQLFVAMNCCSLYNSNPSSCLYNDRILCHDYFNADQNGDPVVSEFVVGSTVTGLASVHPTYPTAPTIMGEFYNDQNVNENITVMATFADPYVYTFTEGPLSVGGPPDNVSWLPNPTYPQTDFLSKFIDFGDPDMIKQMRWLWATGQIYNGIKTNAGLVINNSPTVSSFINYNTQLITLAAPNGDLYSFGVDDDGALTTNLTTDNTFLTTVLVTATDGTLYSIGVDDDGALTITPGSGTPTGNPILASPSGYQFEVFVEESDGNYYLDSQQIFTPGVSPIVLGARNVPPFIGFGGIVPTQGKYVQIYFTGIGILSQYSFDLLLKGRRN